MKSIYILAFLLLSQYSFGQTLEKSIANFGKDDLSVIASYLDNRVTLSIDDNTEVLSRDRAQEKIQTFLTEAQVVKTSARHSGTSKNANQYKIVGIKGVENKYRVFFHYKDQKILEVRIDKV